MTKDVPKKIKEKEPRSFRLSPAGVVQTPVDYVFFNRFAIEEDEVFSLIYLGSVIQGETLACTVTAVAKADIAQAFTVSRPYIEQLGAVSQEPPKSWGYPRTKQTVSIANVIALSCASEVGEIVFSNYGIHELAMVRQGMARELPSVKTVCARSSITLHKQVIGNLFRGMV